LWRRRWRGDRGQEEKVDHDQLNSIGITCAKFRESS
jgi:hypothetical protein